MQLTKKEIEFILDAMYPYYLEDKNIRDALRLLAWKLRDTTLTADE